MSEDRLEKALQAIKSEEPTPEQVSEAGARVWEKLGNPSLCLEFRAQFRDYLEGRLDANRRLLLEDHLGRCSACRARLAEDKGEHNVVPMPPRRVGRWPKWGTWAAAAAVLFLALYIARDSVDNLLAPRGPRATVASLTGGLYLLPTGMLQAGSPISENAVIRTAPGARAVLRLHDGSLVDVNERTELSLHGAWSGQTISLQSGDIIVRAAKQHRGHLQVDTRDSVASVKGTIFAVSAGINGTLVSVVEGSVAVAQPGKEVLLRPGQQAASNPALTGSVKDAVSWSPDAQTYLAVLASLAKIDSQMAALPAPTLRTQSSMLQYVPDSVVVYGAVPNLSGTIGQAVTLAEQQSSENPVFAQWWNSGAGGELKQLIGRIQTVTPLLGDEIVYGICMSGANSTQEIPIMLAEVRQGKRAELEAALKNLGIQTGEAPAYQLSDTLMAVSNSAANLQWLLSHLSRGAGSPFTQEIAARYQDGAAWLLGIDMDAILSMTGAAQPQFISAQQVKHVFLEQRESQGVEENELTVSFNGPRTGLASILASSGSGGAAEYLTNDSIIAVYASTREPQQLFDEITAQLSKLSSLFQSNIANAEAKIGFSFSNDLARAIGTESAFSIEGISTTGPVWTLAVLVNDSSTLDATIRKLVNAINSEFERAGKAERLTIGQEVVDGRTWSTLKLSTQPFSITWTYDRGYLIAGSDRGVAARAIATRNGGSPLVWSPEFKQQIPSTAGLHPSGFAWLNTKGVLSGFASLVSNPILKKLIEERDPILVTFCGTTEQIRAVSRTRLSGLVINLLLLQGMDGARAGSQTANAKLNSRQ
jgi:hypothetical protein